MENSCKELDFSLATEGSSANSFRGASTDNLKKLSNLKLELKTSTQYTEIISDLLTYTAISAEDVSTNLFYKSLVDDFEVAQKRTKDLVNLIHIYITNNQSQL